MAVCPTSCVESLPLLPAKELGRLGLLGDVNHSDSKSGEHPSLHTRDYPLSRAEGIQRLLHGVGQDLARLQTQVDRLQCEKEVLQTAVATEKTFGHCTSQEDAAFCSKALPRMLDEKIMQHCTDIEVTLKGLGANDSCTIRGAPEHIAAILRLLGNSSSESCCSCCSNPSLGTMRKDEAPSVREKAQTAARQPRAPEESPEHPRSVSKRMSSQFLLDSPELIEALGSSSDEEEEILLDTTTEDSLVKGEDEISSRSLEDKLLPVEAKTQAEAASPTNPRRPMLTLAPRVPSFPTLPGRAFGAAAGAACAAKQGFIVATDRAKVFASSPTNPGAAALSFGMIGGVASATSAVQDAGRWARDATAACKLSPGEAKDRVITAADTAKVNIAQAVSKGVTSFVRSS